MFFNYNKSKLTKIFSRNVNWNQSFGFGLSFGCNRNIQNVPVAFCDFYRLSAVILFRDYLAKWVQFILRQIEKKRQISRIFLYYSVNIIKQNLLSGGVIASFFLGQLFCSYENITTKKSPEDPLLDIFRVSCLKR